MTKSLLSPKLSTELMENHKNILRNYIRAKDDNKPHLMKCVFTDSATLVMNVKTDTISFPADTAGLDAITDVLVRDFSQSYENVYTFCLSDSFCLFDLERQENSIVSEVSCDWLVCMTERDGGNVRVGVGRYDWRFDENKNALANQLVITIEQMVVLTPELSKQIFEWVAEVPYPFCDSGSLFEFMPDFESLNLIRKRA